MTVSVWQEVPEPVQAEHDDVVIGAGIVSAYTAPLLRKRGPIVGGNGSANPRPS